MRIHGSTAVRQCFSNTWIMKWVSLTMFFWVDLLMLVKGLTGKLWALSVEGSFFVFNYSINCLSLSSQLVWVESVSSCWFMDLNVNFVFMELADLYTQVHRHCYMPENEPLIDEHNDAYWGKKYKESHKSPLTKHLRAESKTVICSAMVSCCKQGQIYGN